MVPMAMKAVDFSREELQNETLHQKLRLIRKLLAEKSSVLSTVHQSFIGDIDPISPLTVANGLTSTTTRSSTSSLSSNPKSKKKRIRGVKKIQHTAKQAQKNRIDEKNMFVNRNRVVKAATIECDGEKKEEKREKARS